MTDKLEKDNAALRARVKQLEVALAAFSGDADLKERRLEDALRDALEELALAQHIGEMGSWSLQLSTGRVEWSPEMRHLIGVDEATAGAPEDFLALIHPDDLAAAVGNMEKIFSRFLDNESEFRILRDGEIRWIRSACVWQRDDSGAPVRLCGINQDVTRRHNLEAQLIQSSKLEAVDTLAGGIAHDFNNLNMVISATSRLAMESLASGDPLLQDFKDILEASERASTLTRQMLAFSSKQQQLTPTVLDLNAQILDTSELIQRTLGDRISIVHTFDEGQALVLADPSRVQQILINLILNARDAMPGGGTIRIRTRAVDVTVGGLEQHPLAPGRYLEMTLSDDGEGMSPGVLAQIFDPFFTTKPPGSGTGLGLSTVFGLVRKHGGRVVAASEEGQGATFTIYLPTAEAPTGGGRATDSTRGGLVLLVDDEPAVRRSVRRILQRGGYEVVEASSGGDALKCAQEDEANNILLLVTDVVMPRMDGKELAQRLRAKRPEMPVLFISGFTGDPEFLAAFPDEETDFLGKPFMPDELLEKAHRLIGIKAV